jgi:hypothetical protein
MEEQRTLETVFTGSSVEAGLAQGLLEAHGVTAYLSDEYIGVVAPHLAAGGGAGAVKVQVAAADAARARDLLARRPGTI